MQYNQFKGNIEKEEREQEKTSSFFASASQSKHKGKAVMDTPMSTHSLQMLEALHKGEEFKQNLVKISSQL